MFAATPGLASRHWLSPRWFGYHEVWHALGVAAGAILYMANFQLLRGA